MGEFCFNCSVKMQWNAKPSELINTLTYLLLFMKVKSFNLKLLDNTKYQRQILIFLHP